MTEPTLSHREASAVAAHPEAAGADPTLGALMHDLSTQVPQLIRSELRLAQAEVAEKGKRVGVGVGMFSGAGLLAFFGFATLLATIIMALALVMDGWIAALIVTVVLFAIAGLLAAMGKSKVDEATPLAPEKAMAGVQNDIATVKGQRS